MANRIILGNVKGKDGTSATIRPGSITSVGPDELPEVSNSGTEQNAVFDFKIPRGRDGNPGTPGSPGANGKSAFQAAVDAGYTGTEEEFNSSLAGMKDGPFFPAMGGDVGVVNVTGRLTTDGDVEVDFKGCRVQGVNTPKSGTDAANKEYVDAAISAAISGAIEGAY